MTFKQSLEMNAHLTTLLSIDKDIFEQEMKDPNSWLYKTYMQGKVFGKRGWVNPLNVNPRIIKELLKIEDNDKFDCEVARYVKANLSEDIKAIRNSSIDAYLKDIFEQAYKALEQDLLHPALVSITALFDGVLFDVSKNQKKKETKFSVNFEVLKKNSSVENSIHKMSALGSLDGFICEYIAFCDFNEPEPPKYNRNWLMHGRTRRTIHIYDFFRVFTAIRLLIWLIEDE